MDYKVAGSNLFYKCECVPSERNLLIEDQQSGDDNKTQTQNFLGNICSSEVPTFVF